MELAGDLTPANAAALSERIDDGLHARPTYIVLDLSRLDRVDPGAVGTLLGAHLRAQADHVELLLVPAADVVQRVIDRIEGPFFYLQPPPEERSPDR